MVWVWLPVFFWHIQATIGIDFLSKTMYLEAVRATSVGAWGIRPRDEILEVMENYMHTVYVCHMAFSDSSFCFFENFGIFWCWFDSLSFFFEGQNREAATLGHCGSGPCCMAVFGTRDAVAAWQHQAHEKVATAHVELKERFRSLIPSYIRDSSGAIVVLSPDAFAVWEMALLLQPIQHNNVI